MFRWATEAAPLARLARPAASPVARLGGPARTRVIALFAAILGLQSADLATIGAAGGQLEAALGIGHVQLGLLASVSSLVSAAATLPFGVLADRAPRVRLLAGAITLWGAAMVAAGLSDSYGELLVTRVVLGLLTAAAGPVMASLMGDLFPAEERARVYGLVLSGELFGLGFGFMLSGNIAGVLSWRWAFWALALPAAGLAALLLRKLPEPARGGQSRLEPGDREILPAEAAPRQSLEGRRDSLWGAVRHVVRVRTNIVLIAVSAALYFFFGGLETFGVIFVRRQYGLGQSAATSMVTLLGIGALAGVLSGGRIADRLLGRGRPDARVVVAAAGFLVAVALVFAPFLAAWPLLVAMPLYIAGTAALTCANPALDAARLDVMPSGLWGRAEAIRTALRALAVASAPLLFGALSTAIGEGGGEGLRLTFLVMLAPLAIAGVALLAAREGYRRDVAAAALDEEASSR
ncbi:MAG TPA: MFS transporter [Solirubrobacterales bacterium]|nr:MFS transporter [Solirubrobacterales bacterium]